MTYGSWFIFGYNEFLTKVVGETAILFGVLYQWRSYGGVRGVPYPPKENFEAKVLNFAVLSFGSRILSFSFKF